MESYSDIDNGDDSDTGHSTLSVLCPYSDGPIMWLNQR